MLDGSLSPLAPELRALVMVRVSQLNGCRFCVDLNSLTVLQRGISEAKLLAVQVWRSSPQFSELERAALDYAEAMTRQPDAIAASTRDALRDHFDENEIIELTALIAFQNLSSRFNSALGVPPQGFCALPVPATAEEPGDLPHPRAAAPPGSRSPRPD
ncbi:MAG: carboxymuconolactone decarboxylase family protein [Alphaproteobacteria bacterium]